MRRLRFDELMKVVLDPRPHDLEVFAALELLSVREEDIDPEAIARFEARWDALTRTEGPKGSHNFPHLRLVKDGDQARTDTTRRAHGAGDKE